MLKFTASAIVVAAGSSSRMGGKVRKPYLSLRGRPILTWTLSALGKVTGVGQIVIVTRPEDRRRAATAARRAKLPKHIRLDWALGGARRQDSVFNGLQSVSPDSELVLIHDAARPFPPQTAIVTACEHTLRSGAAILACRVKDTVKRELHPIPASHNKKVGRMPPPHNTNISATVPRAGLWLAQTPQVFKRTLLIRLFERLAKEAPDQEFTDDASICEFFRHPVALIESSETNLKVTQQDDLLIAEAYLWIRAQQKR